MPSNNFSLLFLGDVVGPLGRLAVKNYLAANKFDFVIANGENATHGHGLSYAHYQELLSYGVDAITSGNHFYNNKDAFDKNNDFGKEIRPLNLDPSTPLTGTNLFTARDGTKIRVSNVMGRVFLAGAQSNPFYEMDKVIAEDKENILHIVDFHAEATAEKRAMGEYLDGRVTAVIGTHTHVQTADERILPQGTGFITDIGMTGAHHSILGRKVENVVKAMRTQLPYPYDVAEEDSRISGIIATIDTQTKKCEKITRIQVR